MRDILDTLRTADPAVGTAARSELDARAQSELLTVLADGDRLAPRRRPVPRRWAVPGAAAAAVAVLLTGTFGASQIAALRDDNPAGRSALLDPGGGSGGGATGESHADTVAASQARITAALDTFRAAKAKATPPYLFGAHLDPNAGVGQLYLEATADATVVEAVTAGRLSSVDGTATWSQAWNSYRARVATSASGATVAPISATPIRVDVPTAVGSVELDGYDVLVGNPSSGVHLRIPAVPASSYVDLPERAGGLRPVFLSRYAVAATELQLHVVEDENATRGEYALDVRAESDAIVVSLRTIRESQPSASPSPGLMRRTRIVDLPAVALAKPLGGRPVIDAATQSYAAADDVPLPLDGH